MGKGIKSNQFSGIVEKYIKSNSKPNSSERFVIIQVGNDTGATKYIELKQKAGVKYAFAFEHLHFPGSISEVELMRKVEKLNEDNTVSGVMIQSPIPSMDLCSLANKIAPRKDFDGMSTTSLVLPAVVVSMIHYLEFIFLDQNIQEFESLLFNTNYFIQRDDLIRKHLSTRKVCIVNDSIILGKPMSKYFKSLGVHVDVCNKFTKDISVFTKQADVLITATGVKNLIKGSMVKQGAILLDAGFPEADLETESVEEICRLYTPVPGGVGPLTVLSLFENILRLKNFTN